jgi:putative endonuclease
MDTRLQGRSAEDYACEYLQGRGLTLLQRNFRSRYGEIDLVMGDRHNVIFVEVKFRKNTDYGGAVGAVTPYKQQRLIKTALYYLQQHPTPGKSLRFDVVALSPGSSSAPFTTEWLQNVIEYKD